MRVKGQLVPLTAPIIIRDLSRTGFAVVSPASFDAGQMLDFQLTGEAGPVVSVTARAVHSRPMLSAAGLHLSGFTFVPGRLTGMVPQALIDELIATLSPRVPCF